MAEPIETISAATVTDVTTEAVHVTISGSNYIVPMAEWRSVRDPIEDPPSPRADDPVEIVILRPTTEFNPGLASRRRAQRLKHWTFLQEAHDRDLPVEATVVQVEEGVARVDAGCPGELDPGEHGDLEVGQRTTVWIAGLDIRTNWIQYASGPGRRHLLSSAPLGAKVRVKAKHHEPYGLFVTDMHSDALIHKSAAQGIPLSQVPLGSWLDAVVIGRDAHKRVNLGIGDSSELVDEHPLKVREFAASNPVGSILTCRVSSIVYFGAFIDLGGFDGLLHYTKIPSCEKMKVGDHLAEQDEVRVEVLTVDLEQSRVTLAIPAVVTQ